MEFGTMIITVLRYSLTLSLYLFIFGALLIKVYCRLTVGRCKSTNRMNGKTVIITGGNAGIGYETAKDLAMRGARTILGCRNMKKGQEAARKIRVETGNMDVFVKPLDLCSFRSIKEFAHDILTTEHRLNVLINNAGIAAPESRKVSEEGYELTFASNHLGHFLLTNLLLPLLKSSTPSRIINVSSLAHMFGEIKFSNIQFEKHYSSGLVYCNSKLANVYFTRELARRLVGTGITVNALHPGVVQSEFFNQYKSSLTRFFTDYIMLPIMGKSSKEGAQTSIYLAVADEVAGVTGKYFSDCKPDRMSKLTEDQETAVRLWKLSEQMTGLAS